MIGDIQPGAAPISALPAYRGAFRGRGGDLLLLWLKNTLLTLLTLGIYAAWGKANLYRFFYSNTEFAGHRFRFTGNGREILLGLLKAAAVLILLAAVYASAPYLGRLAGSGAVTGLLILAYFVAILFLYQYAVFGSMRYRFSRARYREIRFRLEGSPVRFALTAFKYLLLAVVTLGIAAPFYFHWRIGAIYNNLKFGNLGFGWDAKAGDYFLLVLKGVLLSALTLGIYYFFWYPKMFAFVRGHLSVGEGRFRGEVEPGEFFLLILTNAALVLFTLGMALPWVKVRTLRFYLERLELEGAARLEDAVQAASQQATASGDSMADFLDADVGLGF